MHMILQLLHHHTAVLYDALHCVRVIHCSAFMMLQWHGTIKMLRFEQKLDPDIQV